MKAYQYLDLLDSLRPQRRNKAYRDELCERLNLDTSRKIREFSKGNKQKTGLVGALMHKPDLLLLDEPTSGLDPLVQQTVLELVKEAKQEGRTVFFSSHILSEVQTVCDRVGIIRDGKVVATERIDTLINQQFRRLRLVFEQVPEENAFALEGVTELGRFDHSVTLEIHQNLQMVMEKALQYQIVDIEAHPVTLEEIFLAYYGTGNNHSE
jgi:ABC-2 type transport system ATP-binding protein